MSQDKAEKYYEEITNCIPYKHHFENKHLPVGHYKIPELLMEIRNLRVTIAGLVMSNSENNRMFVRDEDIYFINPVEINTILVVVRNDEKIGYDIIVRT